MITKKEITAYAVLTLCSFGMMGLIAQKYQEEPAEIFAEVESLSSGENDDVDKLVCRCALQSSKSCAVDNWGFKCASGKNVKCWEYDGNCS